jgi:hypothetical protein
MSSPLGASSAACGAVDGGVWAKAGTETTAAAESEASINARKETIKASPNFCGPLIGPSNARCGSDVFDAIGDAANVLDCDGYVAARSQSVQPRNDLAKAKLLAGVRDKRSLDQ